MQYLHTMVRVANLDAALDFYCTKLGLKEVRRVESEKGRFTLVFLAAPEDIARAEKDKAPLIELTYNWDPEDYKGGRNFGHLAYRVDDIYGLCDRLMKAGITINRPPRDGNMAFVRSPDGISIELLQKGEAKAPAEPWASMPNTGRLVSTPESSRSRLEAALAAIADESGEGARAFVRIYAEEARAAADAADARARFGHRLSAIDGAIVSIKDLFDVAGETTRAGTVVYADAAPAHSDAPVVRRLRAAGAVIVGRTNMTELAFSGIGINPHYGSPGNPADRARVSGGSSSGAAVAVADGLCEIAIGSDTGGSVRLPAAFCGIAGFKPTQARVPRTGAMPLSLSLDSIGPLAKSLTLCALTDSILAGETERDLTAKPLGHLVLAVARGALLEGLDSQIERAFSSALARLSRAGVRLVDLDLGPLLAINDAIAAIGSLTAVECADLHAAVLAARPGDIDRRVVTRIRTFSAVTGADYSRMLRLRADAITAATRAFAPFDAVVLPTTPIFAPLIAALEADDDLFARTNLLALRNTTQFNLFDCCGLSLPMPDAGPLPAGFMMMGARMTDDRVLAAGLAVERLFASPSA